MPLDRARLQDWLNGNPQFAGARLRSLHRFSGGASNITCRVDLDGWAAPAVVVRVQRERGIFEPYDVLREAKVHRALVGSRVPVPQVIATEPRTEILGAPFIVVEWIDAPHMGEAGAEADFAAFVRMVATIHQVEWRGGAFDFLGVPRDAAEATAGEVEAVARRMTAFGCDSDPLLRKALDALRGDLPGDGRLGLCQGDINVFNYLFRDRQVVAVVDWEQARIGDPRSDVGQLLALAHLKGAPFGPAQAMPFARAYASVVGEPVQGLEFFRAFWLFQLGVIHRGWVAFSGSEPWYSRHELEGLLEAALSELDA